MSKTGTEGELRSGTGTGTEGELRSQTGTGTEGELRSQTGTGSGSVGGRGFRELYEPWFKAWLVAAPIVGYGSYRLMRTMWARTMGVLAGEEQSAFAEPVIPEGVVEPPTFVIYGMVAAVVFTVFWIVIARVYVNHSDSAEK